MLEIALRTTGDQSLVIGGLILAIFDLLGDLSKSDDLGSISIWILQKKIPELIRHLRTAVAFGTAPTFFGTNWLGLVWDIVCRRVRVIPST